MVFEGMSSESALRRRLLAVAWKCFRYRLMAGTWGNLSVRVDKGRVLITPSGVEKTALRPGDLLLMRLDGKVLKGRLRPTTETAMHLKIYNVRKDVGAVIHTHSPYALVFAVRGEEIPVITVEAASAIGHRIGITRYVRPGSPEMAGEVVETLGDGWAVLVRNHGVVAVGKDLDEAFHTALLVEEEARTYYLARMLGRVEPLQPGEVEALRRGFLEGYGQPGKKMRIGD